MSNETTVHQTPRSRVMLNADVIARQGLADDTVEKIVEVHGLMDGVIESPEDYDDPVSLIEHYEFWLQELWGFPQDRNYHIHWLRTKGCTCPKGDNRLWTGLDVRYISRTCPWHHKGEEN